jgi:hypothetical protein
MEQAIHLTDDDTELSLKLDFSEETTVRLKAMRDKIGADDWYEFFSECLSQFELSLDIATKADERDGTVSLLSEFPDGTSEKVHIYPYRDPQSLM